MNTYEVVRTNYFRVNDADVFRDFIGRVICDEDKLELWEKPSPDGETLFAFGAYGSIIGILDDNGELGDEAYEDFLTGLQECIAVGDAIILMNIGHEKLREVFAEAVVITSDDSDCVDLCDAAVDLANSMLEEQSQGNPWKIQR